MRTIPITCDPDRRLKRLPLNELQRFQGDFKSLHADQYKKLKRSIEDKGFFAPIFVWNSHILDGHQRLNVLEKEGWDLDGGVPVVEIQADNEQDAAEKLLLLSSTYGKVDPQGLYEFAETKGVDLQNFTLPDLPDIDLDAFLGEYYESTPDLPTIEEEAPLLKLCPHCNQPMKEAA